MDAKRAEVSDMKISSVLSCGVFWGVKTVAEQSILQQSDPLTKMEVAAATCLVH